MIQFVITIERQPDKGATGLEVRPLAIKEPAIAEAMLAEAVLAKINSIRSDLLANCDDCPIADRCDHKGHPTVDGHTEGQTCH